MVKKESFLFLILILSVVFAIYGVSATLSGVTLVNPAANANISGNYAFDASITGTASTNVTFYWWNSTSSVWKLLCYNNSGGAGPFTCSYDTSNLPDGSGNIFNATAINSTVTVSDNNTGITIDNTPPSITISSPSAGWKRQNITIRANASDSLTNVTNSTMYFWFGNSTGNFSKTLLTSCGYVNSTVGFRCSATFNTTNLADGNYTFWMNASNGAGSVKNKNLSLLGIDNTLPTANFSCSPTGDLYVNTVVTCTCTPSDSTSGVAPGTSYTRNPDTSGIGTFSLGCSFRDNAGNRGEATTNYSVVYSRGASGSSASSNPVTKLNFFSEINSGTPSVAKGFSSDVGVNQIIINVNQNTNNVDITVTKYLETPSEVSVNKSGKVFQYFHIDTTNLESVLKNATIQIKVNKSWVSSNGLNHSEVSLFKFDNSSKVWNDLNATYSGENSTYYYYNATVTSFSYFAIASKSLPSQTSPSKSSPVNPGNLLWLWISLGAIVVGGIVWFIFYFIGNRGSQKNIKA